MADARPEGESGVPELVATVSELRSELEQERRELAGVRRSLQQADGLLKAVFDSVVDLLALVDESGHYWTTSTSHERVLGVSVDELLGGNWFDDVHPDDLPSLHEAQARTFREGGARVSYRRRARNGEYRWLDTSCGILRNAEGEHVGMVVASRDVTERLAAEASLRTSEERFRSLFAAMNEGLALHRVIRDAEQRIVDYEIVDVNPGYERILGFRREDVMGRPGRAIYRNERPPYLDVYARVAETGEPARFQDHFAPLGRHFSVSVFRPGPEMFATVFEDRTEAVRAEEERREIESRMQSAQKLESLGVLAGGIAHDFNNLLTGILGNASLVLEDIPEGSPLHPCVTDIEQAAVRAADLAKQMLAYAGKASFSVRMLDLSALTRQMAQLLEASVSKRASLEFQLEEAMPTVNADPTQIRQVVMNLILNATEALGDAHGRIFVRTGAQFYAREDLEAMHLGEELPEGEYVFLEVTDTGCGMDEATRRQIFEPFFTTKFTGRGLGLSAVLGIVRGHRGAIAVHSEPGWGSRFTVVLPASGGSATPSQHPPMLAESWRGNGTLLLVDDEPMVLATAQRMLERAGFEVCTAVDGLAAVEVVRRQHKSLRGVVLDLTMPRMDGEEALTHIRRLAPDLPVLISSGYHEQEVSRRFHGQGLLSFVQKPYQYASLLLRLRELLAESPAPSATVDR